MTLAIELRHGEPADARGLASVHLEAWQIGYRGLISAEASSRLSLRARVELWHTALSERQHPNLRRQIDVAFVAGEPVGFVAAGTAPPHEPETAIGEIYALYVRPTLWSRGIGQRLISVALCHLRSISCLRAQLWMVKGNIRAQRFYERGGWAQDGRERTVTPDGLADYPLPIDEICFAKQLAGCAADHGK